MSNLFISLELCKEALFTIEPLNWTGFRIATGVIAPVLPTWYFISIILVLLFSDLYL